MNRQSYLRRVRQLYSFLDNGGVCVYCGAPATTEDHFIPVSVASTMLEIERFPNGLMVRVPACSECNSLAEAKVFNSLGAKRRYIQSRIADKHANTLTMPEWTEFQISQLGHDLQVFVRAGLKDQERTLRRLAWRNRDNPKNVYIVGKNSRPDATSVRQEKNSAPPVAVKKLPINASVNSLLEAKPLFKAKSKKEKNQSSKVSVGSVDSYLIFTGRSNDFVLRTAELFSFEQNKPKMKETYKRFWFWRH